MVSQIFFYIGPSFYFSERKKGNFFYFIVNFFKVLLSKCYQIKTKTYILLYNIMMALSHFCTTVRQFAHPCISPCTIT